MNMTYRYPLFRPNVAHDVVTTLYDVFASGALTQGAREAELETVLSQLFGNRLALTNSCTSALDLAAHLAPIRPNSIVLTTAQTCAATNSVFVHRGAILGWVDVDPLTGNITPTTLERWFDENPSLSVQHRVSALVTVDWGGRPCDYDSLRAVLDRRLHTGVTIIEDAAHATLAEYKQTPIARSGGDFVCFSFQAIKHLTTGDGGALACRAPQIDHFRACKLKWFGIDRTLPGPRFMQDIEEVGFKYHMNDVAAAIGLANVKELPTTMAAHRSNARQLWERLLSVPKISLADFDYGSSYWFFPLLTDERDSLVATLDSAGIESSQVHRRNDSLTAFRRASLVAHTTLQGLDSFSQRQLNLPCGRWMTPAAMDEVADVIRTWAGA